MPTRALFAVCICFGAVAFLSCSHEEEPNRPLGVWYDQTTQTTYSFDDTTWSSGLNYGTYAAKDDNSGTLYLAGMHFADYAISGSQMTITLSVDGTVLVLEKTSNVPLAVHGASDLTRKGFFIAFASDRDGDPLGDIYLYTVDSSAHLDTICYYDAVTVATTVQTDTGPRIVYTVELQKHCIDPVRALVRRPGLDAMPAWSPDGRRLAYVSDSGGVQAIWVYYLDIFGDPMPLSGSLPANPLRLTAPTATMQDANPSWSPDGEYICFERNLAAAGDPIRDVFIIGSTDFGEVAGARNFTQAPDWDCFNPEWSPRADVNIILFEARNSQQSNDWDVYWMSANDTVSFDSRTNQKVTNPNRNGHPTWSPDCRYVAYERNPPGNDSAYDIEVKSVSFVQDSGVQTVSTALTDQANTGTPGLNRYPSWLPNGTLIAFMRLGDIWLIDVSAGFGNPTYRRLLEEPGVRHWDIAW
jgi:Tol biopolymer transport system component